MRDWSFKVGRAKSANVIDKKLAVTSKIKKETKERKVTVSNEANKPWFVERKPKWTCLFSASLYS